MMLEGLPPNAASHVMRLLTDKARALHLTNYLGETFDPADVASSAFEDANSTLKPLPWLVEVYFADEPDQDMLRDLITIATDAETAALAVYDQIATQDWVEASLAGLPPVRAGRFVVHGSHDRIIVQPHEIGIEIEAALAFGTGHHGTTRGCLLLLDAELKRRRPRRVLDVGTGTGVLAIAAARLMHRTVIAGDIDPVATLTARNNALANLAGAYVMPVTAPGLQHPDRKSVV